jgi:arylformamidase
MKFYDITVPLSPATANWPGGVEYRREEIVGTAIVSTLTIRSHYATHVDAPKHFLFDKKSIDQLPLNILVGKYKVFALKSKQQISEADLKPFKINPGDRILFKTRNSTLVTKAAFTRDYVSLSTEAARYLAKKKIALVGIDYFGIEAKGNPGHMVHKTLLSKNIVIVEGVNLSKITPGTYNGAILPLKIEGGDGAPARAILWR